MAGSTDAEAEGDAGTGVTADIRGGEGPVSADLDTEAAFRATRRRAPSATFAGPVRWSRPHGHPITVRLSQGDILVLQPSYGLVERRVAGGGATQWAAPRAPPPDPAARPEYLKGATGQLTSPRALDATRSTRPAWTFSPLARMGVPSDPAKATEAAAREAEERAAFFAAEEDAAAGGSSLVVRIDPWVALAATRVAFPGALDFSLLTGREPRRPRRHGIHEPAVGRYEVAAAFELLAKHVPGPLWAAQGDRWSGFGSSGVSKEAERLGRRQLALDLAAAVAATRPAPPVWTFAPLLLSRRPRRLGEQTDGRPPLMVVSFDLVRARAPGALPFAPPRNQRDARALREAVIAAVGQYRRAGTGMRGRCVKSQSTVPRRWARCALPDEHALFSERCVSLHHHLSDTPRAPPLSLHLPPAARFSTSSSRRAQPSPSASARRASRARGARGGSPEPPPPPL